MTASNRIAGLLAAFLLTACAGIATAAVQSREISYTSADGASLKGYYTWDDSVKGARPGVVVVHEWWGLNDYARSRARELARLGYAALAIDMYGNGKNTEHASDATEMMHGVTNDPKVSYARALAGLDLLKAQKEVDPSRIAAIGYCFGGKVVLDMARRGMDLAGVVSFHGVLGTATPAEKGKVKARVLVLHGAADSFSSAEDIAKFKQEMEAAGVDYTFISYPGAKHAFTNPDADRLARENNIDIGYNAAADKASWKEMQEFLNSLFRRHSTMMHGY